MGYCTLDEKRQILEANHTAATLLGVAWGTLVRQPFARFIGPEDRDAFHLRLNRLFETGESQDCELQMAKVDGTLFWAQLKTTAARTPDGAPAGHLVMNDISERKRADLALRESEKKFRLFFESAGDAIFIHEENGRILAVNPTACEQLGYDHAELMAMAAAQVDSPEEALRVPERVAALLKQGHLEFETIHRRKDGTLFSVDVKTRLIPWSGRTAVMSICRDIAARKQAGEALRESEAQNKAFIHAIPDLIFTNRRDGEYLAIHAADPGLLVGPPEAVLHHKIEDVLPRPIADQCLKAIADALDSNRVEEIHYSIPIDGRERHFEARIAPCTRDTVLTIVRDITERKRAEAEKTKLEADLHQAQKMESIGRLAGGVAHDFNNMLMVILGNAELALDRVDPTQQVHADLEEIRKAAERSAKLTRQLLAFARKQTIFPEILDLNETVAGMLRMLRQLVGEHISLDWLPATEPGLVNVDPVQIDQILTNLCVNSRDAIEGAGTITIQTENTAFDERHCADHEECVPGEYVRLSVDDTGGGMAPEALEHLFEPFFTSKKFGKGTGLGLATVYGIVKQNRGFIRVRSGPGRGTTFQIFFPRQRNKAVPPRQKNPETPAARGDETILLVEDESTILELTTRMIAQQGYAVLAADTPGEALRLAREHAGEIHLLITDVVMPEMNGRDLAAHLLALHPRLKRLFMSGYPVAPHDVRENGECFIQKPFSQQHLAVRIREALDSETP